MITALFSLLLLASDAGAAAPAATPAASATAEAPKEDRKICKREMATESRMGSKRICLTAAEWRQRQTEEVKGLGLVSK